MNIESMTINMLMEKMSELKYKQLVREHENKMKEFNLQFYKNIMSQLENDIENQLKNINENNEEIGTYITHINKLKSDDYIIHANPPIIPITYDNSADKLLIYDAIKTLENDIKNSELDGNILQKRKDEALKMIKKLYDKYNIYNRTELIQYQKIKTHQTNISIMENYIKSHSENHQRKLHNVINSI